MACAENHLFCCLAVFMSNMTIAYTKIGTINVILICVETDVCILT